MTTPTADPLHSFHAPRQLWNTAKTKAAAQDETMSEVIRALLTGWTAGGVMLSRTEALDAADALAYCSDDTAFTGTPEEGRYIALAQRLETATKDAA